MKIALLLGIVSLSGMVGLTISKHYIERKKFFLDLKNFVNSLKNEISFSLIKLIDVVEKLNKQIKNRNINILLANYATILKLKKEMGEDKLFQNISFLNEQERNNVFLFFTRLGRVDVVNQINELDNYSKIFDEYYQNAKANSEKYSSLYTKMGILVGLFIAIIFA